MKFNIWLVIILSFALFLRGVNINNNPPALYGDELTIALDSNSILHTGKDQLGNSFPLTFKMGAGRPAGYVYGSIPFIALFGPTALGVRALSIISGLGIIILLFLICRKLFSKKVALAVTFIAAFSPWDISLSRGGFEAHFALLLALLGIYLFIKAKEKPFFYIFSGLSFGLTLHTYPTYKVSLLFFIPLLLWYAGFKNHRYLVFGLLLLLLLAVTAYSQIFIGGSETRFSEINIFSQDKLKQGIEQKINYERSITDLPDFLSRFLHNRPIEYSKVFIENYLQNFSVDFLILHGDRNPRHNMATIGEIYFAEGILLLFGFLTVWQRNKRPFLFFIFWLIIAPIPSAIVDLPHALRSSFMLPALIILSALGLVTIVGFRNKLLITMLGIVFIIQFTFFIQKLYFLAPNEYSNFWSYSAKLASNKVLQNKNGFDYIILSDRIDAIEFAFPSYAKTEPFDIIKQNKEKTQINGYQFKRFNNVYIGNIPEADVENFIEGLKGKVLYIDLKSEAHFLKNYAILVGLDKKEVLVMKKID